MSKKRKTKVMKHSVTNQLVATFEDGYDKAAEEVMFFLNVDLLKSEHGFHDRFFYVDRGTKNRRYKVKMPGMDDLPSNNALVEMAEKADKKANNDDEEYGAPKNNERF